MTTATATKFWAMPRSQAWAEHYYDSTSRPYRRVLFETLDHLAPFPSLLEVGCASGPNLRYMAARYPQTRCLGVDVNAQAVVAGREYAIREGWRSVSFTQGVLPRDLAGYPDAAFGVVLSCYTLAYIGPRELGTVLSELLRISHRALVLCEPMVADGECGVEITRDDYCEWRHGYAEIFSGVPHVTQRLVPLDPPEGHLNAVLIVERQ